MRKHIPLLLGMFVFVLYATAQQNDGSNNSSASSTQSTSERQPIPAPTSHDFWDGDDPNFANLVTHPFADKKYVQRHTQPIRDRLNELEQVTSENDRMIKDVDSRAGQGLQSASQTSNLADQHATEAGNKAQLAQTAAQQASTRVGSAEQMVANLQQYKGIGQTEIRFRAGQTLLSKDAKDALDQMAAPLHDQHGYVVEVRGFSAGKGQTAMQASHQRADSVVRYLVLTQHIPVYRIYTMSAGNAAAWGQKHGNDSRVEVSVLKNDLESTAQR
jgi:outer membrane protein OmpA-like peptidoglycan-associated protein